MGRSAVGVWLLGIGTSTSEIDKHFREGEGVEEVVLHQQPGRRLFRGIRRDTKRRELE